MKSVAFSPDLDLGDLLQVGADDDGEGLEGGAGGPRVLRAHRSGAKGAEDAPIGGGVLAVLEEGDQLEPMCAEYANMRAGRRYGAAY